MHINSIFLKNFRNLNQLKLDFPKKIVINGPNGSGKTSIVEACYLSLSGKSFRSNDIKEIIRKNDEHFFVETEINDLSGFKRNIKVAYDRTGLRKISIDGQTSSRRDLMDVAFPVIHSPKDMELVSGGPSGRRDFIDRICFMESGEYYDILMEYGKYIKHKNKSLKNGNSEAVDYLNRAAAPLIKKIRKMREEVSKKINKEIKNVSNRLMSGVKITIKTHQDEDILAKLNSKLDIELKKGFAVYGPHLDSVDIKTELSDTKRSLSMGEIYLISVIFKFTELNIYKEKGLYPVFFMDDIFTFLDEKRKAQLFEYINNLKNQSILTSSVERKCEYSEIKFIDISKTC
jgi:DNA replication and repair protein RecF